MHTRSMTMLMPLRGPDCTQNIFSFNQLSCHPPSHPSNDYPWDDDASACQFGIWLAGAKLVAKALPKNTHLKKLSCVSRSLLNPKYSYC